MNSNLTFAISTLNGHILQEMVDFYALFLPFIKTPITKKYAIVRCCHGYQMKAHSLSFQNMCGIAVGNGRKKSYNCFKCKSQ